MAESKGFDLRCGAGRVAALTCHRHLIHFRSRSNPIYAKKEHRGRQVSVFFALCDMIINFKHHSCMEECADNTLSMISIVAAGCEECPCKYKCINECTEPYTLRDLIESAAKINIYRNSHKELICELPGAELRLTSMKYDYVDNSHQPYTE